ncbi:MAG: MBOAT family protein [Oscillospiraceae bacterium]|nr:MBOAT family protein [Oscillospiraceae bacterium]
MLFTSYSFIAFLAVLLVLYYLVPRRFQAPLLLAASCVFYLFAGPLFLIYIAVTTVTVYFAGLRIGDGLKAQSAYIKEHKADLSPEEKKAYKDSAKRVRTRWLVLALVINLGILAAVKYLNFAISNINGILSLFSSARLDFLSIALPLGISYYTLQSIGYLMDVYRGAYEPERKLWRFALFISFFPQLIQGPISRYSDLSPTLYAEHPFDMNSLLRGLERVLWGFFKKLVIADRIFIAVGEIIGDPAAYRGGFILFGMFLYTVELYADFTGGIDITIGVAQMLGIELRENFNRPYFSTSLKEYWRRWHISMCSWFRDYLFYPVSTSRWMSRFKKWNVSRFGQKVGKRIPVYAASFIVWFSTGLWHGASWNFIFWGLLNWAVLMISEELEPLYDRFRKAVPFSQSFGYKIFMMVRTFCLVAVMNLFDCYALLSDTLSCLGSIFIPSAWQGFSLGVLGLSAADYIVIIAGCALMLLVSILSVKGDVREQIAKKPYAVRFVLYFGLFIIILLMGVYGIGYDSGQFIYNRF